MGAVGCARPRSPAVGTVTSNPAAPPAVAAPSSVAPPAVAAVDFGGGVRPILQRRCSPCHFPGGIMHGRLPFDDPATVRLKAAGIMGRLKAPEERLALERWMAAPAH